MPKEYEVGGTVYEFPDHYSDGQVQQILAKQGVIKSQPQAPQHWSQRLGLSNPIASGVVDAAEGAVSGLAGTVYQGGDMIRRGLGMDRIINQPDVQQAMSTPDSLAGRAGHFLEQAAEYAVPAGIATRATKGAGLVARMAGQGAASGATALVQSGGNPVAAGTAMVLGSAGPAIGPAAQAVTARIGKVNPTMAMVKALKPAATNTGFVAALDKAMPEIKAVEQEIGKPISGVRDLLEATKAAKERIWSQLEQIAGPQMQRGVDGTPIAEEMLRSIPAKVRLENPEQVARVVEAASQYRRTFTVQQLETLLQDTNAELQSYYGKYPGAQRAALRANPETAHTVAQAEKLRDLINKSLDSAGEGGAPAELKRRYGALRNIENEVYRRINVAERQAPESLSQQLTKTEAIGKLAKAGYKAARLDLLGAGADAAEAIASAKYSNYLKELNSTDSLVRRSFEQYTKMPQPIHYEPVAPRALLTEGAIRMPGAPDPSGVWAVPGQFAQREPIGNPSRLLPPASRGPIVTPPPADPSGIVSVTDAATAVGRDPKTGRMFRYYRSDPK